MTFLFFYLIIKHNQKTKTNMVINVIFSTLLLIVGCVAALCVLFFGVKFCKDNWNLPDDATWKDVLWELMKSYPLWMWILAFLVFQPCIIHIITVWKPTLWASYGLDPSTSDFIGFITIVFYVLLVKITDESGRFKFLHKSK